MTPLFADAFYYLAMVNPRDQAHERVKAEASSLLGPVVTTAWVLTEVGDALAAPAMRPIFHDLMNELWADEETEIVLTSDALFRRGVALFARRPDKAWSLTDCISFVVMTERGLSEALTGDHLVLFAQVRLAPDPGVLDFGAQDFQHGDHALTRCQVEDSDVRLGNRFGRRSDDDRIVRRQQAQCEGTVQAGRPDQHSGRTSRSGPSR